MIGVTVQYAQQAFTKMQKKPKKFQPWRKDARKALFGVVLVIAWLYAAQRMGVSAQLLLVVTAALGGYAVFFLSRASRRRFAAPVRE